MKQKLFLQIFLQNLLLMKLAVILFNTGRIYGACGRGWVHTHRFCQIIIQSGLNWLDFFMAANHPRHPQNLDSLLFLNTKYMYDKKLFFFAIFFNVI